MINDEISHLILNKLGKNDIVIDIGGGRFPWFRANYVFDKRRFEERVGEIAFGGTKGETEYFSKESWITGDFNEIPWPFEDNFFDFSICMDTLEDLRDPISICKEIQRISKAGYISTPTRAAESKIGINNHPKSNKLYGYFHHRWFVENIDSKLVFKMKHHLLYQNRQWLINTIGQKTLNYFWDNSFECEEQYFTGHDEAIEDAKYFYYKHNNWLEIIKNDRFDNLSQYNNWPENWGTRPKFLDFEHNEDINRENKIKSMFCRFFQKF